MSSTSSASYPAWQRIWDESQPRLLFIQRFLNQEQHPTPRITRVGKLDAELLDQELVQVLLDPLAKALSIVNSAFKGHLEPELTLLIQLTLYKFSLWDTGATYGAKLQGLRYVVPTFQNSHVLTHRLPRRVLLIHGALVMLVPYIHTRLRSHGLSQAWPDAPSSDRRRKAWDILTRLESIHSTLALLNFVAFLLDGRYRMLADRFLRMRLVSTQHVTSRDVSYEFMNRQMVWHAFTEFLLFALPMVNTRALGRKIMHVSSRFSVASMVPSSIREAFDMSAGTSTQSPTRRRGKYWSLPLDQCAICYQDSTTDLSDPATALSSLASPVYTSNNVDSPPGTTEGAEEEPPPYPLNTPYITDCGHTYCYVCVANRMTHIAYDASGVGPGGARWECLRCGQGVVRIDRVENLVDGCESEYGSEDTMSFEFGSEDVDFTDMSGSLGEDSESVESD